MADIPRATRDWLNALLYPPIVFGNTVVTPMSISSSNIREEMPPGWMRGFDVRSGRTWTFHTIPQGDEFGNDTWGGDSRRETGKVGVWTMMNIDPELGYIYLLSTRPRPTTTADTARAPTCSTRASSPSIWKPASGSGTSRSSTTGCGISVDFTPEIQRAARASPSSPFAFSAADPSA